MSRSSTTANSPIESLLDGLVGYLREERGVSAATAETYVPDLRRFLAQNGQRGIGDLTAAAVSKGGAGRGGRLVAGVGAAVCGRVAFVLALLPTGRVDRDGPRHRCCRCPGGGVRRCRKGLVRRRREHCCAPAIGGGRPGAVTMR